MAGASFLPDWRDAAAYRVLAEADRSAFAWEWLRRDENYAKAAGRRIDAREEGASGAWPADAGARPWGLHAFEDPAIAVPRARPVWTAETSGLVLEAQAEAAQTTPRGDLFLLEELSCDAALVRSPAREHLLITDGLRSIRLDLAGTLLAGPVRLRYRIAGIAGAEAPLLVLRRLLSFCRTGRFARELHPREARAARWILMLRAADALAAGASQREIAAELLSGDAAERRWRVEAPSIRSRAQRLVRSARQMRSGGFQSLFR